MRVKLNTGLAGKVTPYLGAADSQTPVNPLQDDPTSRPEADFIHRSVPFTVEYKSASSEDPQASLVTPGLLAKISKAGKVDFEKSKHVLYYDEFLAEVEQDPMKYLRPIARYVLDAIDYWDKVSGIDPDQRVTVLGRKVRPFAFVKKPWEPKELSDKETVRGQLVFWNDLYEKLQVITRKKHPNRMIIVHGPNATGKSRVFETLFQMLEEYSKTDEGALYTYEWVFGDVGTEMGFRADPGGKRKGERIERDSVAVAIPAGKNANPVFILGKEHRVELLNELERQGKIPKDFNKDYIIANGMNDLSSRIYDALYKYYEGDISSVLTHVHVVRWTFSQQARRGLVVIQPQVTPNTRLEPITPDIDWGDLPRPIRNAFGTAGLSVMRGDEANANHGVIVYDDVFKDAGPGAGTHGAMDNFLFLLRFAEKGKTTVSEISTKGRGATSVDEQFDILTFGTTNDDTLMKLQEGYTEWDSLNSRLILTPMWFERCYRDIADVFVNQLMELIPDESGRHISPHVLSTFGLWLTMTYLFPVTNDRYYNSLDINDDLKPRLLALLKRMTILEKALLYQGEDMNSFEFDPQKRKYGAEEQDILTRHTAAVADEYNLGVGKHKFFFYEGSTGLPSRVAETVLERAANAKPAECFSVLELLDTLDEEIKHGFEFELRRAEFLKRTAQTIQRIKDEAKGASLQSSVSQITVLPEPPSTRELLKMVREHEKRQIKFDVYKATECLKERTKLLDELMKYMEHARAYASKKPVKAGFEDPENSSLPSEDFMRRMERIFNPPDGFGANDAARDSFRKKIKEKLGGWILDPKNSGKNPREHIEEIFGDLVEKRVSYDIEANKARVRQFLIDLRIYYERGMDIKTHNMAELEAERAEILEKGIRNLKEMGYCDKCIPKLVFFAFEDWNLYGS